MVGDPPLALSVQLTAGGMRHIELPFHADGTPADAEAVRLVTTLAFDHLRAERVTILCGSRNLRSAAVPRRVGFVHEATLRCERRDGDGSLRDTELFALTRADFESLRAGFAGLRG